MSEATKERKELASPIGSQSGVLKEFSVFKMGSKWGIKRTLSITGLTTSDFYSGMKGPYLFVNALSNAKRFRWRWVAIRKLKSSQHSI